MTTSKRYRFTAHDCYQHPIHAWSLGLGLGLSPFMPGTCGTLLGIPLAFFMMHGLTTPLQCGFVIVVIVFSIYTSGKTAGAFKVGDHPSIVCDEVAGYLLTCLCCLTQPSFLFYIQTFMLFRLFDIIKPWPISLSERYFKGGLGIVIDDLLAGLAAALCWHILFA